MGKYKIAFFAAALMASVAARADDSTSAKTEGDAATQLDAMQIRATAPDLPAIPANVPSTTESFTARQIAESVNSVSSSGALLYLPGVHVRERFIGDVNGGLAMRMYGVNSSAETIVYADGLLLSNFLNNSCCPGPRWGLVQPESIDRVDVMYGPFSALYPGNSVGGVVQISSHMPEKFEAHAKFDIFNESFKLYGTDQDFTGVHGSASAGDKFNDFSFLIGLDRLDNHSHPTDFTAAKKFTGAAPLATNYTVVTGAHVDLDTANAVRVNTAAISMDHTVKDDVTIKLAYDFTPTLRGTYLFNQWRNDSDKNVDTYLRDVSGNPIYGTYPSASTNGKFKYLKIGNDYYTVTAPSMSHSESLYSQHALSLKTNTKGVWDWEANFSYFNYDKDWTRASSNNFGTTASLNAVDGSDTDTNGTGWRTFDLRGEWRPDGNLDSAHQLSFGYHYDMYITRTDKFNLVSGSNFQSSRDGALSTNSRGRTASSAIYLQDAWKFSPDWKLILGGREEKWEAYDGSNYNASASAAYKSTSYADKTVYTFSPKASLSWQASDVWNLKASYGRGVRFPTVQELFANQGIKDINGVSLTQTQINTLIGANPAAQALLTTNNPNLKPETADSWDLTAEKLFNSGVWRVSLFGEEKEDALVSQNDTSKLSGYLISSVQNIDKVRSYGFETSLQTSDWLIRKLDLSGSLTYVHSRIEEDRANRRLEGTELTLIPEWRASALAVYHANDKLSYSLGWRFSARQHTALYDTSKNAYPDPNAETYGGRSSFSVFDAKVLYKFANQWTASAGVDNITNEKYYTLYPYAQRTLFASIKFDY